MPRNLTLSVPRQPGLPGKRAVRRTIHVLHVHICICVYYTASQTGANMIRDKALAAQAKRAVSSCTNILCNTVTDAPFYQHTSIASSHVLHRLITSWTLSSDLIRRLSGVIDQLPLLSWSWLDDCGAWSYHAFVLYM